jgi:hypothetical protein
MLKSFRGMQQVLQKKMKLPMKSTLVTSFGFTFCSEIYCLDVSDFAKIN